MLSGQGVEFRVGAETTQFQQALDAVIQKYRTFETAVNGFNSKMAPHLSTANTHLDTMSTKFTTLGNTISTKVTPAFNLMVRGIGAVAGVVGVLSGVSLKIGGDFQQQMTTVATISRATEKELGALTEKAREMGRDLPRTAREAAAAMTFLAQKGWDVSRITDTVEHVMNLSISQAYGLAESADLLSGVMAAYKMSAQEASRVTDIMNNAANQSALSMEKLRYAYQYAAPVAAAFGVSLEQLSSHFAVLANQNLDGSTIGAGWRMVAQKIQSAAADGGMAFRKLGVEVVDANGKIKDMTTILEGLGDFLSKNPERASEIMKLFGMRAGTVGMILAQQANQLRSYEKSLVQLGSTQEAVNRRMKDWNTVWEIFKSARDDTAITYFNQLQSTVIPVTQRLTDMVNTFNIWLQKTNAGERAILALGEGFGLSLKTGRNFQEWLDAFNLDDLIQKFEDFGAGVSALGKGFAQLINMVPWGLLTDNLGLIVQIITGFWLTGKVLTVIGNVIKLGHAFTWLAAHPVVAGLLAVAGAIALITSEAAKSAKAVEEANRSWEKSTEALQQAEAYLAASRGDQSSFLLLDDQHQKRLLEAFAQDDETIAKFTQEYRDMIAFRAKELGVELGKAISPQGREIQAIFDRYSSEDLMVRRMKEHIGPELLKAWEESGKQGMDAYMENYKNLPEAVRKVVGRAADEIIKARQTREDAGADKNLLLSGDAVEQAMTKLKELSEQAQQTAKDLGIPMEQMGRTFGEQFAKVVEKVLEETAEISNNPFLSAAILRDIDAGFEKTALAATDFGKAGLAAFREVNEESSKTKTALDKLQESLTKTTEPMQVLVEAVKGGFLKGADLDEAHKLINQLANTTKTSGAEVVRTQWKEFGLEVSDSLLEGLSKAFTSKTLESAGMERITKQLPSAFGDFVKNVEAKVPVAENMFIKMANSTETHLNRMGDMVRKAQDNISQVTLIESTDRVGESIAQGIAQPTETGITALDKLHRAAIRAFDTVIQKGRETAAVLATLASSIDLSADKLGAISSFSPVALPSKEMANTALSKGMVPRAQPLQAAAPSSIDARSEIKVDVNIQHMEFKNGDTAGESVAREIAAKVGQHLLSPVTRYQRDMLGALTN